MVKQQTVGIVIVLLLTGCAGKGHYAALEAQKTTVDACRAQVANIVAARAASRPLFNDARDAILWQVVANMNQTNEFASCDDVLVALIHQEGERQRALIRGGFNLGGVAVGVYGAAAIVDDITDMAGKVSSSSTTYNNSRVTTVGDGNASVQASSSGDTLNLGTTSAVDGSQAQGGIEPRQMQFDEITTEEFNSPSQSGPNAPVDQDPGDDVKAPEEEEASIQPVEE